MVLRDVWKEDDVRSPVTARPREAVFVASRRMMDRNVASVVIVDGSNVAGILTERDVVRRVLLTGRDPRRTSVGDVMTRPVVCCNSDASLKDVIRTLMEHGVRHLPVVDGGRLVGVVSIRQAMAAGAAQERGARDVAIFSLAKLAESRDPETGAHLERVREYAVLLARTLAREDGDDRQIDDEFVEMLAAASALHDIGKVAIPDHILLKPDRLTDDEFAVMKTHTTRGAETLGLAIARFPEADFLHMARDIAACHHERHDGRGYPAGLSGRDIPLPARIFAVADVYDALVSRRVYKDAVPHDTARSIILQSEATQFDPALTGAFSRCEQEFRTIRDRFENAPVAA